MALALATIHLERRKWSRLLAALVVAMLATTAIADDDHEEEEEESSYCEEYGDRDRDGVLRRECGGNDCDDRNASVYPGAAEICGDGIDQNCNGADLACAPPPACVPTTEICANGIDEDCDGVDAACPPPACVPVAEVCGDGRDQDCDGLDLACPPPPAGSACADADGDGYAVDDGTCAMDGFAGVDCDDANAQRNAGSLHSCNQYAGGNASATCVGCHGTAARAVHDSVHYQLEGAALYNQNATGSTQGKLAGSINAYCGAVDGVPGNFQACNGCHAGAGALPAAVGNYSDLGNIDCLVCHSPGYKRVKVSGAFVPDEAAMGKTASQAMQTIVRTPGRAACLSCHAMAGGSDNGKRGDLAVAHGTTTDRNFDVHMASSAGNLTCVSCHTVSNHRIAGKGSDLRVTDSDVQMACTTCHTTKANNAGHASTTINRHMARVACQTCHVPRYARDAADVTGTQDTETHRAWTQPHLNASGVYEPTLTRAGNLTPVYSFWDGRTESSVLLGDAMTYDTAAGAYRVQRPVGGIHLTGSKLYPFKRKTANAAFLAGLSMMLPMDMAVYRATGDAMRSAQSARDQLGLDPSLPVSFVTVSTMQVLNHEIATRTAALGAASACGNCHVGTTRQMDLRALGYGLKAAASTVCSQCHGQESFTATSWSSVQGVHTRSDHARYDCSLCHAFSRPERGLRTTR